MRPIRTRTAPVKRKAMAQPTIERRLERKFIVMTRDEALLAALRAQLTPEWELVPVLDLAALGEWNDILLYRFLLLDLDETDAFDPIDVIRAIRMEYMLQIAVFCFGGDRAVRDEMRLARADRFYERAQIAQMLPKFLRQYSWGAAPAQ
mgnify:CR=1 FL=1